LTVVALESAIYSHGFPSPDNIKLAEFVEGAVRDGGAIPATIAILDGIARVGLSKAETEQFCNSAGQATTAKISRRDLAHVIGLVWNQNVLQW
jgi:pseudouridylate synthase / pseudouridine kinase